LSEHPRDETHEVNDSCSEQHDGRPREKRQQDWPGPLVPRETEQEDGGQPESEPDQGRVVLTDSEEHRAGRSMAKPYALVDTRYCGSRHDARWDLNKGCKIDLRTTIQDWHPVFPGLCENLEHRRRRFLGLR